MRLREYLEIKNGLKSNLKEGAMDQSPDLADLIRDAAINQKPANYINKIIDAGYQKGGYASGEAKLYAFNEIDEVLLDMVEDDEVTVNDFPELVWDAIVDQISYPSEFFSIENLAGADGLIYDFYFAALPTADFNYEDYAKDAIAVNKAKNKLYVGDKAFELFNSALEYMCTNNKITTASAAAKFFITNYIANGTQDESEEASEDEVEWAYDNLDSILSKLSTEDFLAACDAGMLTLDNGHYVYLEGDFAWMTGYAWMDLYQKINIEDELNSIAFKSYLASKKINLTDTMTVDTFTNVVFKYLSSKVNSGKIGYKFYDGENHGLLCKVGNKIITIYISLHDDPYLAALDIPSFKAYVDYGMQNEFNGFSGPGMYTTEKVTNTDTVAGLIKKLITSWSVEEY